MSYLPACLGTLLLGVGVWRVLRLRRAVGRLVPVVLWLYSYNFSTTVTLAFSHSLDVGRYCQYQLAYTLLPQFTALWLGWETLALAWTGRAGWWRWAKLHGGRSEGSPKEDGDAGATASSVPPPAAPGRSTTWRSDPFDNLHPSHKVPE